MEKFLRAIMLVSRVQTNIVLGEGGGRIQGVMVEMLIRLEFFITF